MIAIVSEPSKEIHFERANENKKPSWKQNVKEKKSDSKSAYQRSV